MDGGAAQGASDSTSAPSQRFKVLGLGLLFLYSLVLLRRDGEFWPFSKFEMFARARPWTCGLVVELGSPVPDSELAECWERELPGPVLPLHRYHINQDDLSATVRSFKGPLTAEQTAFLAKYFDRVRHDRTLVLYSVRARFRPDRSVRERFTPIAVIGPEGARAITLPVDGGVPQGDASSPLDEAGTPLADAGEAGTFALQDGGAR